MDSVRALVATPGGVIDMRNRIRIATLLAACLVPAVASAEFGGFIHEGCTKDNFMVREQILWDCKGTCADTPLKAAILEEANRTLEFYPRVVASYTKSQIARFAHVPEIMERAELKSQGVRSKNPQFVGTCNPLESIFIRSMEEGS
jgi:hypothetical protein